MKKAFSKVTHLLPALALALGVMTVQSGCGLFFYQAQPPKSMDNYRK